MLRLGLSSVYFKEPTLEKWLAAKEAGITDIEVSCNRSEAEFIAYGDRIVPDIKAAGLHVWSIHIPFGKPYDLSDPDESHFADIERRYKTLIGAGYRWGATVITTHASTEPFDQGEREARMVRGKYLYKLLGDYARERGMRITVEVLPRTCMGNCSGECMEYTDGAVSFINFDVNHLLKESHEDFIRCAGSRIITTHISDYDFVDERHWIPGDGKIDWKTFYTQMEAVGYTGPYLFELGEGISGRIVSPAELVLRFKQAIGCEAV